jgi:natural product biosynthesis luciferase-like monooxygenase protein
VQLSLSFFGSFDSPAGGDRYRLLVDASRFADRHGFAAVWTPERHFHEFGGIFPNPSLTGAFLAAETDRIRIRAGSVVLPLHHPVRVAEEWSVVDNLSGGRVDVSFATGWHPDDFVLAPLLYAPRLERTFEGIETVRRLWRGEPLTAPNGLGLPVTVRLHPPPVQPELPVWITCTGRPARFADAGERGFNVLTALIFQTQEELSARVAEYRAARGRGGHDPAKGTVTLTLHALLGDDPDRVRVSVHEPLTRYLRSSVDLWRRENPALGGLARRADALEFAFERYFRSGLFGTVERCAERVRELGEMGVDEIACLVDFGAAPGAVLESLERLALLRELCDRSR